MNSNELRFILSAGISCIGLMLASCDPGGPIDVAPAPAPTPAIRETPPAAPESDRPVVAETLPYGEIGEQLVYGYFAFPADMVDPLPGLIVIHERWGLDDDIRAEADRIAAQGFVVLAVDLYLGRMASDAAEARELMVELVEKPEPANENLRQAYGFLKDTAQAPRIGVLGWSLGGSWALNAALLLPESLDAAVIYYGQVTGNEERLTALRTPVLGLFGREDRGVTAESVEEFRDLLIGLGKELEIEIYPGAGHAFADPGAPTYNAEIADQAWDRALEFLRRKLVLDD